MLRKRGWGREMGRRWKGIMVRKGEKKGRDRERERGGTWKGSRERGEDVALRPWWREEILRWVSESRGKASQTLWLITDMSSAGWHCKSIVKAFIRCLVEHRAVSPSPPLSPTSGSCFTQSQGKSSISSSRCLYKSEQVRTLRHAVGVIITLEDYNDTPLWTRSPVSTVIKQLFFHVGALYTAWVCVGVSAH